MAHAGVGPGLCRRDGGAGGRDLRRRAVQRLAHARFHWHRGASRPAGMDAGGHAAEAQADHLLLPGGRVRPFGVRRLPARRPARSVGQSARVAQHHLGRHLRAAGVHGRLLCAVAHQLLLAVGAHPPRGGGPRATHVHKARAQPRPRRRRSPPQRVHEDGPLLTAAHARRHLLRRHLLLVAHLQDAAARPLLVRRQRRRVRRVPPRRLLLWDRRQA
mmetsp:Transcript_17519/g.40082  ORF Transcript_17519/g.40082 Transcript_17519/m.40082 type:complete len:216 (+) Transcript_17519:681-1328(+)